MNRRGLIKYGSLGAGLAGAATLAWRYVPPSPSAHLRSPSVLAAELADSLHGNELKDQVFVGYDHPYRQYHNRGVWAGGTNVATAGFSRHQRSLITDLMYAGLSEPGRRLVPNQFYHTLPGALIDNLLICGDPASERCQIVFTGPHLNLRIGGRSVEGVAFGGPQVYGDQRGNEDPGLPGNLYRPQFLAGMSLFNALDVDQQQQALLANSPIQTRIGLQGSSGTFDGLAVAGMSEPQKARVRQMIGLTFAPYPAADVAYAWHCIEQNGGVDALYLSYYEDSTYDAPDGAGGAYQTYRLEGPSAVLYFRGYPHVHAFINVAIDGNAPLSVGEVVGTTSVALEGAALKSLFERAMQRQTGADLGFYNRDSVVGRLRPGVVRTGDIYTAESWENTVVRVAVKGSDITGELRADLVARRLALQPSRTYTVATTDYVVGEVLSTAIGPARELGEHGLLRDLVISDVTEHGFS